MRSLRCLAPALLLSACATTHHVSVTSEPPGATIHDQQSDYLGRTDTVLTVERGRRLQLRLQLDGYQDGASDLGTITGDRNVIVTLVRRPTRVFVTTQPAGAQLSFFRQDGREIEFADIGTVRGEGQFTDRWYVVPDDLGTVHVVMVLDGHKRLEKWVKVEPRLDNTFSFTLDRHTTRYTIESTPPGAEVFERSLGFLGRTPLEKTFEWADIVKLSRSNDPSKLTKVVLHLTVKKAGYKTQEAVETLQLVGASDARLAVKLAKTGKK